MMNVNNIGYLTFRESEIAQVPQLDDAIIATPSDDLGFTFTEPMPQQNPSNKARSISNTYVPGTIVPATESMKSYVIRSTIVSV